MTDIQITREPGVYRDSKGKPYERGRDGEIIDLDPVVELHAAKLAARLLDDAGLDNVPAPEPLVDGFLNLDSLAVCHGKPGNAKSFLAIDLALSVATGSWWNGRAVKQGPVVYLVAEGARGIRNRRDAWKAANGYHAAETGVRWLPVAVDLLDQRWADAFVELVRKQNPVLVILDTLSRTMPGANENAPEAMSRWVDNADRVRAASGACVLIVHHQPKSGEGLRGHSSLEGAVDTAIEVTKANKVVQISCTKSKDSAEFEPIRLQLVPVEGTDSACLRHCQKGVAVTDDDPESERTLWNAIWQFGGSEGIRAGALHRVSGLPETSFYRAKKALVTKGLLVNIGTEKQPLYVPAEGSKP